MTTAADVLKLIKEKEVQFIDLRFTDTKGKEQHVTVPNRVVDDSGPQSPTPRLSRRAAPGTRFRCIREESP